MVSDVIQALHRSWRPGHHQTNSLLLASDGSLLSCIDFTDYGIDYSYQLYVVETDSFGCAYQAAIINPTGLYLAIDLRHEQGDPEALLFRQSGEYDRQEYFSDSLDMIYSWVASVLHKLRREAEGR